MIIYDKICEYIYIYIYILLLLYIIEYNRTYGMTNPGNQGYAAMWGKYHISHLDMLHPAKKNIHVGCDLQKPNPCF